MDVNRDTVSDEFKKIAVKLPPDVLDLCVDICIRLNLPAKIFVDCWLAHALSSENDVVPKVETLEAFEKKMANEMPKEHAHLKSNTLKIGSSSPSTLKRPHETEDIGDVLKPSTPRSSHNRSVDSNVNSTPKRSQPSVFSPPSERTDLDSYGVSSCDWRSSNGEIPEVELFQGFPMSWRTMSQTLHEMACYFAEYTQELAEGIIAQNNLPSPISFKSYSMGTSVFVGKIIKESGRCDPSDVQIQGIGLYCNERISVDIRAVKDYAIFPGQVIAIKGTIINGKIMAEELFTNAMKKISHLPLIKDTLQIMVAAGPFSPPDQLNYKCLHALFEHAKINPPDLLFLIGPFLDLNHGATHSPMVNDTFENTEKKILTEFSQMFKELNTKVYCVSSFKDLNSMPLFPTPVSDTNISNYVVLPDPAHICMKDINIGFTSVDVLLHMSMYETSNCKGSRLARLCRHLLQQQSYYPIYPSPQEFAVDYPKLFGYSSIKIIPHVLVVPSALQGFAMEVDGCLFINPERCLKGTNFARIEVRPQMTDTEKWSVQTHVSAKNFRL